MYAFKAQCQALYEQIELLHETYGNVLYETDESTYDLLATTKELADSGRSLHRDSVSEIDALIVINTIRTAICTIKTRIELNKQTESQVEYVTPDYEEYVKAREARKQAESGQW